MLKTSQKNILPFKIVCSNVDGGFIDKVHLEFADGIDLTNYHEDNYGLDGAVLQGPFTSTWVGGYSYRHVDINKGTDESSNRQEPWHLEFNPSGVSIHSHSFRNSPPSYWSRGNLAKSSVNIKNVPTMLENQNLGNYRKNYEILQTSGRRISNNLIADGLIASSQLLTRFVNGIDDYSLPLLDSQSKSVIVERFSSPGSKEESSRGSLDREGEEFSANSPLPFRNHYIRKEYYKNLSIPTPQFGGTVHNINRNTLVRAGITYKDNGFIVNSLPRTDIQYSWIKDTSTTTSEDLGGYQSFDGNYNTRNAYEDIDFVSGSLTYNGTNQSYFLDNIFISSIIKNQKTVDLENRTFSIGEAYVGMSFAEATNTPYTFTSWTSIRNSEGYISRLSRKSNILFVNKPPRPSLIKVEIPNFNSIIDANTFITRKFQNTTSFKEPPVSFKYKPIENKFRFVGAPENTNQFILHTYVNNMSTFANKELLFTLGSKDYRDNQFYDLLRELYNNIGTPDNPIEKLHHYRYKEIIWPKEENTGLNRTRKRFRYYLDRPGFTRDGYDKQLGTQRAYWRDERKNRKRGRSDIILLDDDGTPILTEQQEVIYIGPGGHINSFNYYSVEEEGLPFSISGESILIDENTYSFISTFDPDILEIENGFHNSMAIMENVTEETSVYSSSLIFRQGDSGGIEGKETNICYKNGNYFGTTIEGILQASAGELNNNFVDFYGISKVSSSSGIPNVSGTIKINDVGAVYRNTYYKSLLTTKHYELDSLRAQADVIKLVKTEDDETRINPKLRYVAFVGGGELNISEYVKQNFKFESEGNTGTIFEGPPPDYTLIPDTLFEQTFSKEDIQFSTLDNGLKRKTEEISGKKPFFDSYEEYLEDIRGLVKDYSVIPEFKMHDHIYHYVDDFASDFETRNRKFLYLDGIGPEYRSAEEYDGPFNGQFFKQYVHSDLLKKHDEIREENKDLIRAEDITIRVDGVKKLLPYNGFYPQDRITQIANLYNEYVDNNLAGGIFNASYEDLRGGNTTFIINHRQSDIAKIKVTDIDFVEYDGFYYVAISYPSYNNNTGLISIYKTNANSFLYEEDWIQTPIQVITGGKPNRRLGENIKFVVGPTSLELFYSSIESPAAIDITQRDFPGQIFKVTSLDWSDSIVLEADYGGSSVPMKGDDIAAQEDITLDQSSLFFGYDFEVTYDSSIGKYILCVGAPYTSKVVSSGHGTTTLVSGLILIYESTNGIDNWQKVYRRFGNPDVSPVSLLGTSLSLLKKTDGTYRLFASAPRQIVSKDPSKQGYVYLFERDGSGNWNDKVIIQGSQLDTELGCDKIKALEIDNKEYVFYIENGKSTNGLTRNGVIYMAASGDGYFWDSIDNSLPTTIELYHGIEDYSFYSPDVINPTSLTLLPTLSTPYIPLPQGGGVYLPLWLDSVDHLDIIKTGTDLKISFGEGETFSSVKLKNITFNMITQQVSTPNVIETDYLLTGGTLKSFYSGSNDEAPHLVYSDQQNLYILPLIEQGRKFSLNLVVESEEAKKAFKHAAIEPLLAPGIIYNTIKSGIAVDWPSVTGSANVSFTDSGRLVNGYYPEPFVMASSLSDSGNIYTLQGNLKSKINYRIPFENSINIREIFEEKQELTNNITEYYDYEADECELRPLIEAGFITKFLQGCYIYGGYENYLSPTDVGDFYGLSPKRFSVPFVYKKINSNDNQLYTKAVSNFYAECVKFFLKEEKMTTFVSRPDNEWPSFIKDKTYTMDVILEKTSGFTMMEAYHSDKHPIGPNGEKMDGRYFGYPVNKTNLRLWKRQETVCPPSGEESGDIKQELTLEESKLIFNDPAYAPYTPPYFEGRAIARLSFTPQQDGKYSLDELFSQLEITDIFPFVEEGKGWEEGSDAQVHKMTIGSSVELFGNLQSVTTSLTSIKEGSIIQSRDIKQELSNKIWVISPRMEVPVLDFSDQEFEPFEKSYLKTSGYGRGMWSGYGKVPIGDSGIKMSLTFPFYREQRTTSKFGKNKLPDNISLLDHVGFDVKEEKIGEVAESKIISEAVVMIPYLDTGVPGTIYNELLQKHIFAVDYEIFKVQKENLEQGKSAISQGDFGMEKEIKETSISSTIKTIPKYVIPPELDYYHNDKIAPFIMYMFEFNHKLEKQDLVDIWQGVMPEISRVARVASEKSEIPDLLEINHKFTPFDFFHGRPLPNELKWMVFKVKKRAETKYTNITKYTRNDVRFDPRLEIGRKEELYSYNWPYDYFSLIEFAKIEIDVRYKNKEDFDDEEYDLSRSSNLPPLFTYK